MRPSQPLNGFPSIVRTLGGMVIEVRLLQPENTPEPILMTLGGMAIEVRHEHQKYLQPIITQYFIDNKSEIWLLFLIAHSKR